MSCNDSHNTMVGKSNDQGTCPPNSLCIIVLAHGHDNYLVCFSLQVLCLCWWKYYNMQAEIKGGWETTNWFGVALSSSPLDTCVYHITQECRILTTTCMNIAWLTVYKYYACSILSGILNYIPCTWTGYWLHTLHLLKQGSGTVLFIWVRVGGRHLAMSLYKLKATFNWIMHWEPLPVYTVTALITDQQGTKL